MNNSASTDDSDALPFLAGPCGPQPVSARNNRILHIDGDSFFASCEIALDSKLEGRPVWVGGGRRGDGIVIAANRHAKRFGIKTGTACFEAKRLCPSGVLCKPHYDAYRELSRQMFLILEQYAPTLVPYSIDEGFLDFSTMDEHMWRNTTPTDYVQGIRQRILKETRLPVTAGLGNSAKLAKLATDAAKGTGFIEVKAGEEKDFLNDRPVGEMSGIGRNRQRSLAALGALTFGHVAKLPSMLLKQKFGIWGQQLWLFSNGQWNEPLVLEIKDRTTISSSTTLPQDEHDYEAALTFMLSEATRLTGQLRREQMQAREFSLGIRFTDFTEVGTSFRFKHPQFLNSIINEALTAMFREIMPQMGRPVRQIRLMAISAFAGVRHAEIQRLDWANVDKEANIIEIRAGAAKTASRRVIPILPNLAAWLKPHWKEAGPVCSFTNMVDQFKDMTRKVNQARRAAWAKAKGVGEEALKEADERATKRRLAENKKQTGRRARGSVLPAGSETAAEEGWAPFAWKHNALRHSFISYRVAETQDAAKVSLEAGNSPQMIFKHYRELVRPDAAKAWFAITPKT